jgi:hypothetical protein
VRRSSQILSCVVVCAFLLISCAFKSEQTLVGKWQEVSGKETIEFLKGRAFQADMIWDLTKTSVNVRGTYSVEGDIVNLKPDKPADLVPMRCQFKLSNSNNELTVTFQNGGALKRDGSSSRFRRIG